ncbi:unnamed protein product [Rotaria magnacalcarata]|uniref:Uncharacterized protein n=1 Tax=Rotaria magnacalcarata TaxID=392030 RepID=A0A816N220_9BILA|nr:unnamed protein product [Rotaria magnacalcarata]CAF3999532.1 unnamed protein product [Rotaria magnacalcarata]
MECKHITAYSALPEEQEVIIMPGTRLYIKHQPLNYMDSLFIVHLEEQVGERSVTTEPIPEKIKLVELIEKKYLRNDQIKRIVNEEKAFPIEESCINLAMIEAEEQKQKEKKLQQPGQEEDQNRSRSHKNNKILGIFEEIYGAKTPIEVKDVLDESRDPIKKILVLGRAGIGKSSFCQ